jgi:hypothetical protein
MTWTYDPVLDDVYAAVVEMNAWLDYADQSDDDPRTIEAVTILVQHAQESVERDAPELLPRKE